MKRKRIFLFIALLVVGLPFLSAQNTARIQQLQAELNQMTADFSAGKITAQEFQRRAVEIQQEMQREQQAWANSQQAETRRMEQTSPSFSDAQMRRLLELHDQHNMLKAKQNEGRLTSADERQAEAIVREIEQIWSPFRDLPRENMINIGLQQEELEKQLKKLWPGAAPGWPSATGEDSYVTRAQLGPFRQAAGTRASYSIGRFTFNGPVVSYRFYQSNANAQIFQDLRRQIEASIRQPMEQRSSNSYYAWHLMRGSNVDGWEIWLSFGANDGVVNLSLNYGHDYQD